jgi:hypothetical protein
MVTAANNACLRLVIITAFRIAGMKLSGIGGAKISCQYCWEVPGLRWGSHEGLLCVEYACGWLKLIVP